MAILILKLVLTPILIGFATLIGKVFGPALSGWIVGLPLTSGPIALIFALEHGRIFARDASEGILSGVISVVLFCIVYSVLSRRFHCLWSEIGGLVVYFMTTYVLELWLPSLLYLTIVVFTILAIATYLLRTGEMAIHIKASSPRWDLPARMSVATGFVLLLTSIAPFLGPHLSGLLAPFPIFVSVLTVFTHIFEGGAGARRLLYGVILGLFSFAAFFITVTIFIQPFGIQFAFIAATVAALAAQGLLALLKRSYVLFGQS